HPGSNPIHWTTGALNGYLGCYVVGSEVSIRDECLTQKIWGGGVLPVFATNKESLAELCGQAWRFATFAPSQGMKIHTTISDFQGVTRPVLTTGTFDGVHLGHQVILDRL